jgi:bacteriocin-like protein
MTNRRINPKSGVIELTDEQLNSVTGGGTKRSGEPVHYFEIKMTDVLISSVALSGQ